jgi:hypothetical protein
VSQSQLSAEAAVITWLETCMSWLGWILLAGDVVLVGVLWFREFGREVFELDDRQDPVGFINPAGMRSLTPANAVRFLAARIGAKRS